MSASRMPTLNPWTFNAKARLAVTVDLPTPPLPDAMAMMFLTPASGGFLSRGVCWYGMFVVLGGGALLPGVCVILCAGKWGCCV